MQNTVLTFKQAIEAPVADIYHAFTNAAGLQEWFADVVEADARAGGRFYCYWNDGYYTAGLYESLEENRKVVFTWNGLNEPSPTTVEVSLTENAGTTEVILTHTLPGTGAEWDQLAKSINENWPPMLANLKSVAETGVDKRFYERPLLGFYIGGLVNENLKERLGLPVDRGVHVAGLVDGMGAQKSGLQADDVIYMIDGDLLGEFQAFPPIMARHKGGDVVKAIIYRGSEKIELDIELSKRPIPEFPAEPEVLAHQAETAYNEVLQKLDDVLVGISEADASQRPAKGEWSVKHVLAHLLINERWSQYSWDRQADNHKLPPYPGSPRTVDAIAEAYSAEALLAELRLSIRQHLVMMRTLPAEFAGRKGTYFALASGLVSGISIHWAQHLSQIEAALQAVQTNHAVPA